MTRFYMYLLKFDNKLNVATFLITLPKLDKVKNNSKLNKPQFMLAERVSALFRSHEIHTRT